MKTKAPAMKTVDDLWTLWMSGAERRCDKARGCPQAPVDDGEKRRGEWG